MKTVTIFHHKLACAHQTETGACFITEFCFDLIKVQRQMFVACYPVTDNIYHHLFMRRTKDKKIVFTVTKAKQLFAELLYAAALLPQFRRCYKTQVNLLRPDCFHLFSYDRFDLFKHTLSERQVIIKPAGNLGDKTGP